MDTPDSDGHVEPSQDEIYARIASEMAGQPIPQLTEQQIAAAEQRQTEHALELDILRWQQEHDRQEAQRRQAEQDERSRLELVRQHQRETAARLRQEQAHRDSQEAARRAQQTQTFLARQEFERRQRVAIEEQRAFFRSLGPMGNPAPQPSNADVIAHIDRIAEQMEPPEPTLHERLTDPRRFKFDWQP